MSSEIAIQIRQLGKCYHIYDRPQDRLWQSLWRGRKQFHREFWALRDVSFDIRKGETVGIIGRNGSGKSTLLQLIAGTLTPTTGEVRVNGRIAALLELGSGFNPEFTGRENVYMNAAILGLSTDEIDGRFDEIAAFADIGDFIDQPVKNYSSGMIVRLAFAVSVCIEPDILIVDEALAVGDELFQRKCFDRIHSLKNRGSTILFVSHSAQTVVELCDLGILIENGYQLMIGSPKAVVESYHKLIFAPENKREEVRKSLQQTRASATPLLPTSAPAASTKDVRQEACWDPSLTPQSTLSYESQGATIVEPHIEDLTGRHVNVLVRGGTYQFVYRVDFLQGAYGVRFGMLIKTILGVELGGATSTLPGQEISHISAGTSAEARFRFRCLLSPGLYFLNAGCGGVVNGEHVFLHRIMDAAVFRVSPESASLCSGIVDFQIEPEVRLGTFQT